MQHAQSKRAICGEARLLGTTEQAKAFLAALHQLHTCVTPFKQVRDLAKLGFGQLLGSIVQGRTLSCSADLGGRQGFSIMERNPAALRSHPSRFGCDLLGHLTVMQLLEVFVGTARLAELDQRYLFPGREHR